MGIPTQFGVTVETPKPVTIEIDVSERTMIMGAFLVIIGAVTITKLKR